MLLPMKPAGKVVSVLTLPSILIMRPRTMNLTSAAVRAYFNLFLSRITRGRDSLREWGPSEGLGAYANMRWCADDIREFIVKYSVC